MTPQTANRILLVAIAIFVVVMIWRIVATHLRYRRARRQNEEGEAYRRALAALEDLNQ